MLKIVTYIKTRVFLSALKALAVIKPIAIGVRPMAKPISVIAVRLVSLAENAPCWKRTCTIGRASSIIAPVDTAVLIPTIHRYKRKVALNADIFLLVA